MSKAEIKNGEIKINLFDLVAELSAEDKRTLARAIVAKKELFAAVLECVTSESRVGHFFSDDPDGEWWFGSDTLLELREKLIPLMSQVAQGAVREALMQRNEAREHRSQYSRWAWRLYHAWPDYYRGCRPDCPAMVLASEPTSEEVAALMRDQQSEGE